MRIEVDCASSRVVEATPEEREWIRNYLTFSDPQARFSNGNPVVELVNPIDDTFPSGFAGKVRKAGEARLLPSGKPAPITVELVDVRTRPPPRQAVDLAWLRDYQRQAVETALTKARGIVQMPTGAGKSVAAAGIVASVPEARWLVLVPQSDLLEQFAKHIRERLGEEPGIIGDGQWNPQRITVATFQTLSRRMTKNRDQRAFAFMRSVQGMIVDEAHQCASGSFSFVCSQAVTAFYRIGISATPLDRTDKKSVFVIAQLGGLIHKTSSAELRARGFLADATVKMVRCVQGSNAPTWPGVYGECVVRSKARNALIAQMATVAAKPALVFVNHVKHGATVLPLIRKAGLQAKLVWGEADTEERREAIKDLVEGRLDVIVCSNVFAQGVDIPSLKSVINAAGGSSVILTLQRLGRGTRVTESKTTFEAWDVLDDGNRYLAKHGRTRQDTYEREGFKVEVIDHLSGVEGAPDPRKDEHGFVLGSSAQAKWRADQRKEALQALAGVDKMRNPSRCKVLRPHQMSDGECQLCGASVGNLAPECPGYQPEEASQPSLLK